jgi:very-short-patch-repair endonuclease
MVSTRSDSDDIVSNRLQEWQRRLLDLSGRNPLIYFNRARTTRVQITSPSLIPLTDRLLDGRVLRFSEPAAAELFEVLADEGQSGSTRVRQGDVETTTEVRELQRRLMRLKTNARSAIEEQGLNVLYLALGLLEWREAPTSQETVLSPLFLLPVGILREANRPFEMKTLEDEEATDNPALRFRLEIDFGLRFPDAPAHESLSGEQLTYYLESIEVLTRKQGWNVRREAWLSTFSFESLVLYRDIETNKETYLHHPVIRWLAGAERPEQADYPINLEDVDHAVSPRDMFPVLDADDSQLKVLLRARAGEHLVVHGPPGTGKSQTIANVIAQSIRDGKRVLFVSRKRAALDVVFNRLRDVGLDEICLEAHSHRANKRSVIRTLNDSLERGKFAAPQGLEQFEELAQARSRLNDYTRALLRMRDERHRSAYDMTGRIAKLSHIKDVPSPFSGADVFRMDYLREQRLIEALRDLTSSGVFDGWTSHPWRGCEIRIVVPEIRTKLSTSLRQIIGLIEALDETYVSSKTFCRLDYPTSFESLQRFGLIMACVAKAPQALPLGLIKCSLEESVVLTDTLRQCTDIAGDLATYAGRFNQVFMSSIVSRDLDELVVRFSQEYKTPLRFLSKGYRRDMEFLRPHLNVRHAAYRKLVAALSAAKSYRDARQYLDSQAAILRPQLAEYVQAGADSDWSVIYSAASWWAEVASHLPKMDQYLVTSLSLNLRKTAQTASRCADETRRVYESLLECVGALTEYYPGGIDGQPLHEASLPWLRTWAQQAIAALSSLDEWAAFSRAYDQCQQLGISSFTRTAYASGVEGRDLQNALLKSLAVAWLSEAIFQDSALANFESRSHEQTRTEFRRLDNRLRRVAARQVLANATSGRPNAMASTVATSEVGILRHQAQLQKRHMSPRKLFSTIPTLLLTLKPCLMMSPLSVASYLRPDLFQFDLVVFDEASQVPPEEALAAIVRSKQVIVAGDEKQLPPTSFFHALTRADDDDDDDATPITDSILEQCIPIFSEEFLDWHYRSKDERLIAFSNREFYQGRLITIPSAYPSEEQGVFFKHVPNGVFDRGASKTNRIEAQEIATLVLEHFQHHADKSLGVIAMSVSQRDAIERELYRQLHESPELEGIYQELSSEERVEPFFIKNLEQVQGDERDMVILGLGYAPDATGSLFMQFGPLSRAGGWRRLNVAITRARQKATLVASMHSWQLDMTRLTSGAADVGYLQRYMDYAARGGEFPPQPAGSIEEVESEFEEAVLSRLRREGLVVDTQVGTSGFRIDLAIRHPDIPTRYLLAVECDGAAYHRSWSARQRDRLRQEVLERSGWRFFRIWSPDWLRDEDGVVSRILADVETLRTTDIGIPAQDYQPVVPSTEPDEDEVLGASQPNTDSRRRAQSDIQAIEIVLERNLSLPIEALFREAGKLRGYGRVGRLIRRDLEAALAELIRSGRAHMTPDGKVSRTQ